MHRSIRIGLFAGILAASALTSARADELANAPATAESTASVAAQSAVPAPGADLAMWNAAPSAIAQEKESVARLSPVRRFANGIVARSAALASSLTRSAMRFLGTPYVFGGTHTTGFDCSGYVQHVFAMIGVHLPRTADAQFERAHAIAGEKRAGDLVFFQTYTSGVSHVGIYLGNDKFVSASSSRGVTVSSLHDSYWAARYLGAKRVVQN